MVIIMTHYLIEFRFQGKEKAEIKQKIYALDKKFNLGFVKSKKPIPHISLAGPLTTNKERKLIQDFESICSSTPFCSFKVNGYGFFEEKGVVYIRIDPSEKLKLLRWELSQRLAPYCELKDFDHEKEFIFHATLALKLSGPEFRKIKRHIEESENPKFKQFLVRATLIKNQRILCEYDFLQRKLLTRSEALDRNQYSHTMRLLREFFAGKYDPDQNLGTYSAINTSEKPSSQKTTTLQKIKEIVQSFLSPINATSKKGNTFLISDTHFDHENIIKYCHRPFTNKEQMNQFLINRWNSVVKKEDTVFFLGDMTYGRGHKPIEYWMNQLNGRIIFISGSHDEEEYPDHQEFAVLNYRDKEFYLVHDPKDIPDNWDGWVIHGHHHNNKIREFPFIDGEKKTINVSVELIDYTPLNIDELFAMDFENVEYKETSNTN